MTTRFPKFVGLVCLLTVAAFATGCSSKGKEKGDRPDNPFRADARPGDARTPLTDRELRLEADQAYRRAHESLLSGDYETASTRFTQLISRYPFSDYATQSELEKIYAQYRSFQADEAVLAVDRFLREHPRHPNADYVQYIKGLVDSGRDSGLVDYLPLDNSKRDATNSRRAYDDFALLLQRFPNSRYAGDSRKRMIYLRNRVAAHELSVTRYYIKRGAWVAAAKRGEAILSEYPGAPATAEALLLLKESYMRLGEKAQLAEIEQLIEVNKSSLQAANASVPNTPQTLSVVAAPETVPAATPVATTTAPTSATAASEEPPKGIFGRAAGLLDYLNKTYTVPTATPDGTAAAAAATTSPANASRPIEPDYAAPASLTTGPYSGPDTATATIPINRSTTPVEAEGNPQPLPSAPAAVRAPTAAATTPSSSTTTSAVPAVVPSSSTAVPAAAAATPATPKEKSGGFLDFLNKTYTIGGSKKPAATAAPASAPVESTTPPATTNPAPEAAQPAAPSSSSATEPAPNRGRFKTTLDYEDDKAAAPVTAPDATPPAPAPAPEPATK